MKTFLMLLAALYGGQAIADDAAPAAEKTVPPAKHKVVKHKKDCIEKDGKPCHLHKLADSSASKRAEPEDQAKAPPDIMKTTVPTAVAVPAAAVAAARPEAKAEPEAKVESAVSATDALALAKKQGCLVCHAVDKKVVGPAWRDVAAKYRGDATAETYLVNKIAKGGSGAWGNIQMPAHPKISEADRRALSRFVLNLQ